jgi:putative transferase (TIGR04331 family)
MNRLDAIAEQRRSTDRPILKAGRIIVGQVPADFDVNRDTPVGPWCFAGAEDVYRGWEALRYPRVFQDTDELKFWDDRLKQLSETLVAEMVERMNEKHGVNYSGKFWYILLIQWVHEVCQLVFYRYMEVVAFLEMYDIDEASLREPVNASSWRFAGQADFYDRGVTNVHFNGLVSAKVFQALAGGAISHEAVTFDVGAPYSDPSPNTSDASLKTMFKRLYANAKKSRCDVGGIICEFDYVSKMRSYFAHIVMNFALSYLIPRKRSIRAATPRQTPGIRQQFPEAFIRVLDDVLLISRPVSLDDDFKQLNQAARQIKCRPGRLNIRVVAFYLDNALLFSMAQRVENGEGLLFLQHGSNYGTANAHSLAQLVEYRQHAFISWGWRKHGNYEGRFMPLPSPQLRVWRNAHQTKSDTLLFVAGTVPFMPSRLCSLGEIFCETRRRRDRCRFLKGLSGDFSSRLIYRPAHNLDYTAEEGPFMSRNFPDMTQCLDQRRFYQHLRECKLLVMDSPGTTLYMALAAGVPFIGFWPEDQWPLDPDVKPYFDNLRRCSVIHDSPEQALDKINQIWGRIDDWRRSPEVAAAVDDLRRYNARASSFWLFTWLRELWRLT